MKRILITGANSYIGTSFEKWVAQWPEEYYVDTVGTRNGEWKELDFSSYDVVFHVAGIAHVKETKKNRHLYYLVNRDLAIDVANKASEVGVKQFILLSSMSVYGLEKGIINKKTPLTPKNAYGQSKLEAERAIESMQSDDFTVTILRPPMIYGKGCKGNYQKIAKLATIVPLFPEINNSRSMIYIDNLNEIVRKLIDKNGKGLYFPQNIEFVTTSEMVKCIAKAHGKDIKLIKGFNPLLKGLNFKLINKIFGDLTYEKNMSEFGCDYIVCNLEESIVLTEAVNGEI